jgi:hypothetical protein
MNADDLSRLKSYHKQHIIVVKYYIPLILALIPVIFFLAAVITIDLIYLVLVLFTIALILHLYYDFKEKILTRKIWYPEKIFEKDKYLIFYVLAGANVSIVLVYLVIFVILKLSSEIGFTDIIVPIGINSFIPLFIYTLKKAPDYSKSNAKKFKIRVKELEKIVESSLDQLKMKYEKKQRIPSRWVVKPFTYVVEGGHLNISIFVRNGIGIRFNPVSDEDNNRIQKISS